jgi:predicted nucleic acid-binding protein
VEDAALSAKLYRPEQRPRGSDIDLAIAACAINHGARLWAVNRADFADVPGLKLYIPT